MDYHSTHFSLAKTLGLYVLFFALFVVRDARIAPLEVGACAYYLPWVEEIFAFFRLIPRWLVWGMEFFGVLAGGVMLTRIAVKNLIFPQRSYITLLGFELFYFGILGEIPLVLILPVLSEIYIIYLILNGFRRGNSVREYFIASILSALATLVFPPFITVALALVISTKVLNRTFREFFVTLLGFLLPFFFTTYTVWALDGNFADTALAFWNRQLNYRNSLPNEWFFEGDRLHRILFWIAVGTTALATLGGIVNSYRHEIVCRTRQRKALAVFTTFLLCSVLGIFHRNFSPLVLVPMIVPVALLVSFFFNNASGRFYTWFYWFFVIYLALYSFYWVLS